jgi:hypothetical protein
MCFSGLAILLFFPLVEKTKKMLGLKWKTAEEAGVWMTTKREKREPVRRGR